MSQMIESFMQPGVQEPAAAQAIELEEPGVAPGGGAPLLRQVHPLHGVKVRLRVCVGEAEMSIGQLLGARESEVLVLERRVEHPVDLVLEGKVVARGELVAVDGFFAVRITELPLPLRL
jgi:flagellar motor switch protein FliN/FliY